MQSGTVDEATGGGPAPRPPRRPVRVLVLAALVAVEALAVVGVGAFLVIELVVAEARDPVAGGFLALLAVAVGVGLGACARGAYRAQRWTRAPVLTWQILQASIAWPMLDSELRTVGLVLVVMSIVTGLGMVRGFEVTPPR